VRDDFEKRRADGQPVGFIVKAWRAAPPTPAAAAEESKWAKYARESPGLYVLADDDLPDDQADESLVVEGDDQ
jgi:hypothetical protein